MVKQTEAKACEIAKKGRDEDVGIIFLMIRECIEVVDCMIHVNSVVKDTQTEKGSKKETNATWDKEIQRLRC